MKIITVSAYKGGVGKTTSSVCLASLLHEYGSTLLIDSDPNRSATYWAREGHLPFKVCTDASAAKLMGQNKFDFVVIDTPARPTKDEVVELSQGCDLLLLPTTPDDLSIDALAGMTQHIPSDANYQILVTMIPPAPQTDGKDAIQGLQEAGLPVLEKGIRFYKVYKRAVSEGQLLNSVKGGKRVWRDWTELAKLKPLRDLLDLAIS